MMVILFLLLVLCSFWLIGRMNAKSVPNNEDDCANVPIGKATRHKWVLRFPGGESDHMGYLVCTKCGKIPGQE